MEIDRESQKVIEHMCAFVVVDMESTSSRIAGFCNSVFVRCVQFLLTAHLLHETCINNDNFYFVRYYIVKEMKTSGTRDDINIHQSSSLAREIKIIETDDSQSSEIFFPSLKSPNRVGFICCIHDSILLS